MERRSNKFGLHARKTFADLAMQVKAPRDYYLIVEFSFEEELPDKMEYTSEIFWHKGESVEYVYKNFIDLLHSQNMKVSDIQWVELTVKDESYWEKKYGTQERWSRWED